ncbi:MAG TPA: DMT family transporter [Methylibium sp.]|uniref:DMT family transporter n=1 Tax=Methylibium sp. TaxID=2067992 RepID=UPI002DB6E2EA|nr:DMT family transporter [Methylibium sp.]HEU4460063.1 DMT family transporter [Methylibium sp.]
MEQRAPWWAYACLAASMALVGSYVGLSKLLVAVLPVFLLAWLRFGIAAVAMAHWLKQGAHEAPLTPRDRRLLFLESFFGNFLFSICMLYGVRHSSALAAGVVLAALPAVVALLSWWLLRERPAPRVLAGVACAVGGIALASASVAREAQGASSSWLGPVLLLGALVCEAVYVVIGKKLTASVSPKRISAIVNLWGLALVTPLGAWQAASFEFQTVAPSMWLLLVFYALAASIWTVWLWMTGLRQVPASSAGVYTVWLPISAAAVGVGLLGERLGAVQAAAFALALLGVVLATGVRRR